MPGFCGVIFLPGTSGGVPWFAAARMATFVPMVEATATGVPSSVRITTISKIMTGTTPGPGPWTINLTSPNEMAASLSPPYS